MGAQRFGIGVIGCGGISASHFRAIREIPRDCEVVPPCDVHRAAGTKLAIVSECMNPRHRFLKERVLPEIGALRFSFLLDFYWRGRSYYESAPWRGSWRGEGGAAMINQAIYTWDPLAWLQGGVEAAYGYWGNL